MTEPPRDLTARLDAELRSRIEEAIDFVCLDVMVRARLERGLPAPAVDNPRDREEFSRDVRSFLVRLRADLTTGLAEAERRRVEARVRPGGDEVAQLLAAQVALAKALPDYWQCFDAARLAYATERVRSGGEHGSLFARLFGHG